MLQLSEVFGVYRLGFRKDQQCLYGRRTVAFNTAKIVGFTVTTLSFRLVGYQPMRRVNSWTCSEGDQSHCFAAALLRESSRLRRKINIYIYISVNRLVSAGR